MAAAMAGERGERRGIQSVGIGIRVLSVVAGMGGPATLSSIAQKAAMSPSQAHRYLSSLIASGMLRQDTSTGLYDLDSGTIRIGLAALSRVDVFVNAEVYVRELVKRTRRTCLLAVIGEMGPTVVRWFPGSPPVITSLAIGSILPLLRSATGRIFHTFGDRLEMDRQTRLIETANPSEIPCDLDATRLQIERNLVTTVAGDLTPGLRAVSAPVFDLQGRLAMAMTLLAGSSFRTADDATVQAELITTCRSLTESLGGVWPSAELRDAAAEASPGRRRRADAVQPA